AVALANLVENAAKYSPAGSEITIAGTVTGGSLFMSVTDRGMGIDAAEAGLVFDKFYRGSQPPGKPTHGTGMGLSIARGIIEAHGGRIWVDSQVGSGSKFSFSIPIESKRIGHVDADEPDETLSAPARNGD